jgi:hypothetical protein
MGTAVEFGTLFRMHSSTTTGTVIQERAMHDTSNDETKTCRHCEGLSQGKAERCHFCGRWLLKVAELVS